MSLAQRSVLNREAPRTAHGWPRRAAVPISLQRLREASETATGDRRPVKLHGSSPIGGYQANMAATPADTHAPDAHAPNAGGRILDEPPRARLPGEPPHSSRARNSPTADNPPSAGLRAAAQRRWFERRAAVLGTALCIAAAIFVARDIVHSREEMLGLLYVIPVALTGLELGFRAGVAAALGTLLLIAVHRSSNSPSLDALAVATRGVALLSVGAIAGRFSDRMRDARAHMYEHHRSAEHVLGVHERERRGIAEQLHEQAAQGMAATLLLVRRMEPHALGHVDPAHVAEVRESVHDCIATLRELAARLRPPALDELGLVPALERLMESRKSPGSVSAEPGGALPRLPAGTETLAYRVAEEMVCCMPSATAVRVGVHGDRLRIEIQSGRPPMPSDWLEAALATTGAHLKIVGGSISSRALGDGAQLVTVHIPMLGVPSPTA